MKPLISIQILNWNRAEETQRAIQSAVNQTYPNIEIIVVDNGSEDNSVQLTKQNYPDIKVVELDKNYGCPGGRNLGIPYCSGKYIFYLDNDGVLHKEAVNNAFRSINSDASIGIVTGAIYDFESKDEIDPNCEIRNNVQYLNNEFDAGICMHDKKIYEEAGLYPSHFIYGAEESFLTLKLFDTKYKILKDESVILWHRASDLARDKTKENLNSYFNNLYIAATLFPLENFLLYFFYFLVKYPLYAYRAGILKPFIKKLSTDFFNTIKKGINERTPVSRSAFYNFRRFAKEEVTLSK